VKDAGRKLGVIDLEKLIFLPQFDILLEALTLATTSMIVITMKMATTRNARSMQQRSPFL